MTTKRRPSTEWDLKDWDDQAQTTSDVLKDRVVRKAGVDVLKEGDSVSIFAGFGGLKVIPKETDAKTHPFEFLAKSPKQGEDEGSTAPKLDFQFKLHDKQQDGKFSSGFQFGMGNIAGESAKPSSGFSMGEEKKPTASFSFESSNANFAFGTKDSSTGSFSSLNFGSAESSKTSFSFCCTTISKPGREDVPQQRSFSFGGSPSEAVQPVTVQDMPSFVDMFNKPKPGSSCKCSFCDKTNTVDKARCVACATLKSGVGDSKAPGEKWECPLCIVSNDSENKLKFNKFLDSNVFSGREDSSGTPAPTRGFHSTTLPASTPENDCEFGVASSTNAQAKTIDTRERYSEEFLEDLKDLNYSVSEWIESHVDRNGFIYLTPVFQDYEKHLSGLKDQYKVRDFLRETSSTTTGFGTNGVVEKKKDIVPETGFTFSTTATTEPRSGFSFGSAPLNSGFPSSTTSSSYKRSDNLFGSKASGTKMPFSFGPNPKEFTIGSIPLKTTLGDKGTTQESGDEKDIPPEVEISPVVEEDSLFSVRCKIFYKKGSEFAEKGLGMLHLKPVDADGVKKIQMLIRADTNLGNILLNIILSSKISFLRRNNHLQFVCIPNPPIPGLEPGPITMLIKVKNAEVANDLETHISARLTESN